MIKLNSLGDSPFIMTCMHIHTCNICLENILFYLLESSPKYAEVKEKEKETDSDDG